LTKEEIFENPVKRILFDEAIISWDLECSIKYSLHFQVTFDNFKKFQIFLVHKFLNKTKDV
jgi:hypothetical protein